MPGLAGFIKNKNYSEPIKVLGKMQDFLTHKSFYVKGELFSDEHICATRSHINIFQREKQPCKKNGLLVWMDGEINNNDEVSKEFDLRTQNDPELLASLYELDKSFSFMRRIDGLFSAVLYDRKRMLVHLISDRWGLRHLYWTNRDDSLVWGSEVKVVLPLPGYSPKINKKSVEDFFRNGFLLGDETWLSDVKLLDPATVLTWDINKRDFDFKRYWSWDEVVPLKGKTSENEIVEELGRLFDKAVKRLCREGERLGLALSGGLDSRAVLAAMPELSSKIQAWTFGMKDSQDVEFASKAAKIKKADHHVIELNSVNWLRPRLKTVWWTDGQMNLEDLHGIEGIESAKKHFDVSLNGFFADAILGGSYFYVPEWSTLRLFVEKGRHCTIFGPKTGAVFFEYRLPICNNDLLEFSMSIPEEMKADSNLYNKMLVKMYPEFFKTVPWQKTGKTLDYPQWKLSARKLKKRIENKFKRTFNLPIRNETSKEYTDYDGWLRVNPGRSFLKELLENPKAIYADYLDKNNVLNMIEEHMSGRGHSRKLLEHLTFEIWLQQVFEGKYKD